MDSPGKSTPTERNNVNATGIVRIYLKQPPGHEIVLDQPMTEKWYLEHVLEGVDGAQAWVAFESVGPLVGVPVENIAYITFSR